MRKARRATGVAAYFLGVTSMACPPLSWMFAESIATLAPSGTLIPPALFPLASMFLICRPWKSRDGNGDSVACSGGATDRVAEGVPFDSFARVHRDAILRWNFHRYEQGSQR